MSPPLALSPPLVVDQVGELETKVAQIGRWDLGAPVRLRRFRFVVSQRNRDGRPRRE